MEPMIKRDEVVHWFWSVISNSLNQIFCLIFFQKVMVNPSRSASDWCNAMVLNAMVFKSGIIIFGKSGKLAVTWWTIITIRCNWVVYMGSIHSISQRRWILLILFELSIPGKNLAYQLLCIIVLVCQNCIQIYLFRLLDSYLNLTWS